MNEQTYTIRFPRKGMVHITGLAIATTGGGNDMGSHVSYAADSHCSALTRGATRFGYETYTVTTPVGGGKVRDETFIKHYDTPTDALVAAEKIAKRHGGSVCSKCQAAATR